MEVFESQVLFQSPEEQETQRIRQRNRLAKRASRARQRQFGKENNMNNIVTTCDSTPQDAAPPSKRIAPPPQPQPSPESLCAPTPDLLSPLTPFPMDSTKDICQDDSRFSFWDDSLDEDWTESYHLSSMPILPLYQDSDTHKMSYESLLKESSHQTTNSSHHKQKPSPAAAGEASVDSMLTFDEETTLPSGPSTDNLLSKSATLLHIAVRNGTTGILMALIKAGGDVNSHDKSGTPLLHLAVRFRQAGVLKVLIDHGANVNKRNSEDMTALEIAVRAQDEETVNILLSGGAELK